MPSAPPPLTLPLAANAILFEAVLNATIDEFNSTAYLGLLCAHTNLAARFIRMDVSSGSVDVRTVIPNPPSNSDGSVPFSLVDIFARMSNLVTIEGSTNSVADAALGVGVISAALSFTFVSSPPPPLEPPSNTPPPAVETPSNTTSPPPSPPTLDTMSSVAAVGSASLTSSKGQLNVGALVGVVVAAVAGAGVLFFIGYCLYRDHREKAAIAINKLRAAQRRKKQEAKDASARRRGEYFARPTEEGPDQLEGRIRWPDEIMEPTSWMDRVMAALEAASPRPSPDNSRLPSQFPSVGSSAHPAGAREGWPQSAAPAATDPGIGSSNGVRWVQARLNLTPDSPAKTPITLTPTRVAAAESRLSQMGFACSSAEPTLKLSVETGVSTDTGASSATSPVVLMPPPYNESGGPEPSPLSSRAPETPLSAWGPMSSQMGATCWVPTDSFAIDSKAAPAPEGGLDASKIPVIFGGVEDAPATGSANAAACASSSIPIDFGGVVDAPANGSAKGASCESSSGRRRRSIVSLDKGGISPSTGLWLQASVKQVRASSRSSSLLTGWRSGKWALGTSGEQPAEPSTQHMGDVGFETDAAAVARRSDLDDCCDSAAAAVEAAAAAEGLEPVAAADLESAAAVPTSGSSSSSLFRRVTVGSNLAPQAALWLEANVRMQRASAFLSATTSGGDEATSSAEQNAGQPVSSALSPSSAGMAALDRARSLKQGRAASLSRKLSGKLSFPRRSSKGAYQSSGEAGAPAQEDVAARKASSKPSFSRRIRRSTGSDLESFEEEPDVSTSHSGAHKSTTPRTLSGAPSSYFSHAPSRIRRASGGSGLDANACASTNVHQSFRTEKAEATSPGPRAFTNLLPPTSTSAAGMLALARSNSNDEEGGLRT